jgi:hypothetical protein
MFIVTLLVLLDGQNLAIGICLTLSSHTLDLLHVKGLMIN